MTKLEEQLAADVTAAQRARSPELNVLRLVKSAIGNEVIAKGPGAELSEQDVLTVLRRELKKRHEAAKLYEQGGRAELAAQEKAEADIVARYLPQAPSADDVLATVKKFKTELGLSGPQGMGSLTKAVLAHYQGAADGATVSAAVKQVLNT
jgi:uncharacterized protein YqeY